MAEHVTGGELYTLWRVSEVNLPRVADVYYDANTKLAGARTGKGGETDSDGFRSVATGAGGEEMSSPIGAAWGLLRDELLDMFGQVENTVVAAAAGIRQATKDFVATDQASADELSKYLHDPANHTQDPEDNPPTEKPGKPVMPTE